MLPRMNGRRAPEIGSESEVIPVNDVSENTGIPEADEFGHALLDTMEN